MDSAPPFSPAAPALSAAKHIVDSLIEERAPRLSRGALWPMLRPLLYGALNYDRATRMADAIAPMGGREALEYVSRLLRLKLEVTGLERMPKSGPFLLLANHPTGITDGMAVYDAVKQGRPDVLIYANSDAHRVCPGFTDSLIPVEWVPAKRTRARTRLTLQMTGEAVAAGQPVIIFPAGRLARKRGGLLTDPEWMATAASLARKYKLPLLPCHVAGPYSFWFHGFSAFSDELRDITLFHEFLNKQGKTYRLRFGPLIPAEAVDGEAVSVTRRIKYYVERVLADDGDAAYDANGPECAWRDPIGPGTKNPP